MAEETFHWYAKRFRIETFFSDQKRRGFHLHKSHISDPERMPRLLIAACLAYIWIIYLGVIAKQEKVKSYFATLSLCNNWRKAHTIYRRV